jgi:hypothetical protein
MPDASKLKVSGKIIFDYSINYCMHKKESINCRAIRCRSYGV